MTTEVCFSRKGDRNLVTKYYGAHETSTNYDYNYLTSYMKSYLKSYVKTSKRSYVARYLTRYLTGFVASDVKRIVTTFLTSYYKMLPSACGAAVSHSNFNTSFAVFY